MKFLINFSCYFVWNNEIFDILNDMLLGKITVYQKEILIEKLKLVEKFLNM